jgi:peptidyl-prolyl cis-trans isomerase B (cyclophilin B)
MRRIPFWTLWTALLFVGVARITLAQAPPVPTSPVPTPQATPPQAPPSVPAPAPVLPPANAKPFLNAVIAVHPIAVIETAKGVIKIELYPEEAPKTVENFVTLARKGFYDGLTFHRVVPNFVIQGGDPSADGTGGPGYRIEDEQNKSLTHDVGAVGMAKTPDQPNSAGSQFYVVIKKSAHLLDGRFTLFGRVIEGQSVAEQIVAGDKMTKVTITEPEAALPPAGTSGGDSTAATAAEVMKIVLPALTDRMRSGAFKQSVKATITIDADGTHTDLIEPSGSPDADRAVADALKRWEWKSAMKDGKPVKSMKQIQIELVVR